MLGQPPQRVQTADPHVRLVVAELVDGMPELLGEVPFLREPQRVLANAKLPPRGVRAEEQHDAGRALQERRADAVDRGEPVLRRDVSGTEIVVDHHPGHLDEGDAQEHQPDGPGQPDDDGAAFRDPHESKPRGTGEP
jgi:hypothetical protein